ncbi:hypothetical protein [Pseudoduganella violacea]|uniref:Uncharacterized protein n=1 Tax=Pseudoduganella violacea TaxID=1715466 RepID=A0A7W5FWC1_9BURK|nr:hypothetical protein [Pseudoduganella violacea]MBB3121699.1 hypothetical protein [Pseudoduganella violacea]
MNKQTGIAKESAAQPSRTAQADIELRPVDHSDQPILANFVALQASPGLVFLDFGFLDFQAINSIARLANDNTTGPTSFRGRLVCRVALTGDTVASLVRQLNQLVQPHRPEQVNQPHQERLETAAKEPSLH